MDEVWDFAGQIVNFVDNTDWMCGAFPFGKSPFSLYRVPTHKPSGIMDDLQGVNTNNALLQPDGFPTALAYYYLGQPN